VNLVRASPCTGKVLPYDWNGLLEEGRCSGAHTHHAEDESPLLADPMGLRDHEEAYKPAAIGSGDRVTGVDVDEVAVDDYVMLRAEKAADNDTSIFYFDGIDVPLYLGKVIVSLCCATVCSCCRLPVQPTPLSLAYEAYTPSRWPTKPIPHLVYLMHR